MAKVEYTTTPSLKDDLTRIKAALHAQGYEASYFDCEMLWDIYTKELDPELRWETVPQNLDEIFDCIKEYIIN